MFHEKTLINLEDINDLRENGIIKVKNFLNENELKEIRDITKSYSLPKGHSKSYRSTSIRLLLYKILKLNFKKFKQDVKILNLAKKKNLNFISDRVFGEKSYLKFIDIYHTPISNEDLLPWHTDMAYQGDEKNYEGFVNPDHVHIKFFIYLTDVGPNNGCTSYIPKSHKLGYSIRKGIFKKIIKYQPYFTLKEFRNFISKKENADFIKKDLNDEKIIEEFLNKTNFIENGERSEEFDFSLKAGDAIIFDEGGLHKGSKSLLNERVVLRYLYSIKK
jgi:ectoine hydroxylase-related dioxygenase (phytanoyl-CoA dioxygenase family)